MTLGENVSKQQVDLLALAKMIAANESKLATLESRIVTLEQEVVVPPQAAPA
jgi:hypothetical protein